jgi:AraC-like DNA-binding protein
MLKQKIKQLIESRIDEDGLIETGIEGIKLFRVSEAHECVPVVYNPVVIAIVSGSKEAILDGKSYIFDSSHYLCCPVNIPLEAGVSNASPENPLLGVHISLDTKLMRDISIEIEKSTRNVSISKYESSFSAIELASWDEAFTEALFRLLKLGYNSLDTKILGEARLQELYYAILKGESGSAAKSAFSIGNEITRSIEYISSRYNLPITIDDIAGQVGMSRAAFHRKFKQATTMSPIQFVKSMRLNKGAEKLGTGMNVNEVAMQVGYVSSSQFSREFKRMYGESPKRWIDSRNIYF